VHFKPLPDELLSSLIVRLAYGHGVKVRTFSRLVFPSQEIWNRDIDRNAPPALLSMIAANTGASYEALYKSSLKAYEGVLYKQYQLSSILPWVLPLQVYEWKRNGFAQHYCPSCLANDGIPYYRRSWRIAYCTWCPQHACMLHNSCFSCGSCVAFHRCDLGNFDISDVSSIHRCWHCGFDYRDTPRIAADFYSPDILASFRTLLVALEASQSADTSDSIVQFHNVLHHLCLLLGMKNKQVAIADFACAALSIDQISKPTRRQPIESRSLDERHHLVQLAIWYLLQLDERLTAAWVNRSITYNRLLKDLRDLPDWYGDVVSKFTHWRDRLKPPPFECY
jgi:hypothetical protein